MVGLFHNGEKCRISKMSASTRRFLGRFCTWIDLNEGFMLRQFLSSQGRLGMFNFT